MSMQAKVPGDGLRAQGVDLTVDYGEALGGDGPDPYERLIGDASTAILDCSPDRIRSRRRGASSRASSTPEHRSTTTGAAVRA